MSTNSVSLSILLEADGGTLEPRAHRHDTYGTGIIGSIEFGRGTGSHLGLQADSPEAFDALAKAAVEVAAKMRALAAEREKSARCNEGRTDNVTCPEHGVCHYGDSEVVS